MCDEHLFFGWRRVLMRCDHNAGFDWWWWCDHLVAISPVAIIALCAKKKHRLVIYSEIISTRTRAQSEHFKARPLLRTQHTHNRSIKLHLTSALRRSSNCAHNYGIISRKISYANNGRSCASMRRAHAQRTTRTRREGCVVHGVNKI